MAVVREFFIGNAHIKINNEYCKNQTVEEKQKLLDRIAINYIDIIRNIEMEEMKKNSII